jgi:predicted aldo/keto reductase-like oxidoreductase
MSNDHESRVTRRRFLEHGSTIAASAALVGTATAGLGGDAKAEMKYRRFGRTGLTVSEIGLGCATGLRSRQLGPEGFNRYREQLPTLVEMLLARGGNFVATSASYHDTEEILGRALKGRRKGVIIFTSASPGKDVNEVIASCERSLKRFQTDVIDCYFGHGGFSEAFYEAALKLKEQGKIRFIGQSCHVPAKHRELVEADRLDFVFQPYNYMALAKWTEKIDRNGAEELFAFCKEKNVGVIVMKPMTGHYIPNWAKDSSEPKVAGLLGELKQLGTKNLYQAFLMWILKNPNVSCVAIGMNEPQDVVEDCEAVAQKLTGLHYRLLEHYAAAIRDDYCRLCETCLPSCPQGIPIPDILRFRMYYKNYGHREDARELYAGLPQAKQFTACTACGLCQQTCPNRLAIVDKLQEAHALLT